MSQHLSAHELLHFRLTTNGQLDHPGNQLFRSVLDEYGVALAAHALAEERLADCRRAAAALHETVMSILEACVPLVNAEGWSDTEGSRRLVLAAMDAYGVVNR